MSPHPQCYGGETEAWTWTLGLCLPVPVGIPSSLTQKQRQPREGHTCTPPVWPPHSINCIRKESGLVSPLMKILRSPFVIWSLPPDSLPPPLPKLPWSSFYFRRFELPCVLFLLPCSCCLYSVPHLFQGPDKRLLPKDGLS